MSTNQAADAVRMQRALAGAIHEHWGLYLTEGIILVVLGIAAIVVPPLASLAVTIFLGWLFLIGRDNALPAVPSQPPPKLPV